MTWPASSRLAVAIRGAERTFNKLARTFAAQVETLKRYRSEGGQTVRDPFQKSPRCTATSKRTRERCKAPAVRGWTVCRFHGARGGAPRGGANGSFKHGLHTVEARAERRALSNLLRQSRRTIVACEGDQ
jgi:hypothetical protein